MSVTGPGRAEVNGLQAEERLGLLSVLQELTVSALDLFDPEKSPDVFLERLAERLGCPVALCLAVEAGSAPTLLGAVGLARASRGLPLGIDSGGWASRPLPYPETLLPGMKRWCFALPGSRAAGVQEWVLLLFRAEELPLSGQHRRMLHRLTIVLGAALLHRRLFARTQESERRLREQKAMLECQSEASLDGVLIFSPDGKVLSHNRRLTELWRLPADLRRFEREAISTAMASRVEDPAGFLARSEELWRSGDLRAHDQVRLRDGRILERHCAPVLGDDGVRWGRGCFWRDVTGRQRVEHELRQERDFSAAILDTVGALVLVLDREGRIVRFNAACQRATGYSQEELRGEPFWGRLVAPADVAAVREAILRAPHEPRPIAQELGLLTRDGGVRRIAWATAALAEADGAAEFLIGTGIDVTEQRRVEAERDRLLAAEQTARALAEERERRAELLAEASGILGSTLELEEALGRLARLAVPRLADLCVIDVQRPTGEVQRAAVAFHDPGHQELARRIQASLPDLGAQSGPGAVLRTGELCLCGEPDCGGDALSGSPGAVVDLAGPWVFRSYLSAPMLARGRLLGALTLGMVREGRRYDDSDVESCLELARRAALAVDTGWLYEQAREAVRARDEFISIASHDLRSPVTALRLAVHGALAASRDEVPPERLRRSLSMIDRQERRIARLIDELLDVSRAQAGTLELELQPVDLAGLAREVVARFAEEVSEAGAGSVITVRAQGQVVGSWDRSRLDQVLTNLLTNALKFGEGKPIEVEVSSSGGRARLAVRDRGIGIAPEEQGKLFQRYQRLASATPHPGLGLGLYIVRQIVERLGGSVRVESRPGEGALFEVELPCTGPAEEVAPGTCRLEPEPAPAPAGPA